MDTTQTLVMLATLNAFLIVAQLLLQRMFNKEREKHFAWLDKYDQESARRHDEFMTAWDTYRRCEDEDDAPHDDAKEEVGT